MYFYMKTQGQEKHMLLLLNIFLPRFIYLASEVLVVYTVCVINWDQ